MKWTELTPEEIDALEGDELDLAVGEAMGYEMSKVRDSFKRRYTKERRVRLKKPNGRTGFWYPHDDANQALEVWAAMPKDDSEHFHALTLWFDSSVDLDVDYEAMRHYRGESGTFCEAICRAYLKVRLTEESTE